jgi:hypothetical protein
MEKIAGTKNGSLSATRDAPFRAKLRQRTIRESLLTLQRFDQCVRKV